MTFTFTKSELAKILSVMSPYLGGKDMMGLRLVKGGTLEMFVTALIEGGSVLARIPCNKSEKATKWMHIDGVVFQQLVQIADEGVITLDIGENSLTLKYPRSTSEIRFAHSILSPDDVKFGTGSATIKGMDLNLLSTMTEAASTDETRPSLHGVYIAASGKKLEAAAADGFILSFASLKAQIEATGALYSVKALGRAKRAIKAGDDEDVSIGFHAGGIALSIARNSADFFFEIPRLEGSFPDYKAIVSGAPKAMTIEVETGAFAAFLKRANAINGNVFIQAVGGFLWVMAQNETTKEKSVDSIPIETKDESAVMYYAHELLKDTLTACAANGKVTMTFPKTNKSPMLFEGGAGVIAMPLINPLKESPFKDMQPALI